MEDYYLSPPETPETFQPGSAGIRLTPSPLSAPPSASHYIFCEVLRLVNVFGDKVRKHTQTTVTEQAVPTSHEANAHHYLTLEQQAFAQINNLLVQRRDRQPYTTASRSQRATSSDTPSVQTNHQSSAFTDGCLSTKDVDRLILNIEQFGVDSLTTLTKQYQCFLQGQSDLVTRQLAIRAAIFLSISVDDLLKACSRQLKGSRNIALQPPLLGYSEIDQANIDHLLHCLRHDLLKQIVDHCVDNLQRHISNIQKAQSRDEQAWDLSEYPDAKHPFSTTWLWSIRPFLAILWAVCWMFYDGLVCLDKDGNLVDRQGVVQVPAQVVRRYRNLTVRPQAVANSGLDNGIVVDPARRVVTAPRSPVAPIVAPRAPAPRAPAPQQFDAGFLLDTTAESMPVTHVHSPISATQTIYPTASPASPHPHRHRQAPSPYVHNDNRAAIESDVAGRAHLSVSGTSNQPVEFRAAPQSPYDAQIDFGQATTSWGLPQDLSNTSSLGLSSSTFIAADTSGLSVPPESIVGQDPDYIVQVSQQIRPAGRQQRLHRPSFDHAQNLPPSSQRRVSSTHAPGIRLTPQPHNNFQAYSSPQATTYHSSSATHSQLNNYLSYPTNLSGHLSIPPGFMTSVQDQGDMQIPSPVSAQYPSPHHDPGLSEQPPTRKRSHSIMSQQDPALQSQQLHGTPQHGDSQLHIRAGSYEDANGQSPQEEYSRGSHAFKRENPPTNDENKYICTFSEECLGMTFDRKCEWSKHMDKHDRPYRCPHPSCAKLQGFTYSGGLLRHEREVHGKHGGPKAQLMCPHLDCKRHTGKGFTRKENLNEHLRRVHTNKEGSQSQQAPMSQMTVSTGLRRDGTDLFPGADDSLDTPASRIASDAADLDDLRLVSPTTNGKRKRDLIDGMHDPSLYEGSEDIRDEVKRLRAEADVKDQHILRLQEDLMAQRQEKTDLEQLLAKLRQEQQQPQEVV